MKKKQMPMQNGRKTKMKRFKRRGRSDDCVSCFIGSHWQGCWPDAAKRHRAWHSAHSGPTLRLVQPPKRAPYLILRLPRLTKSTGVEVNLEIAANERDARQLTVLKSPYYPHRLQHTQYFRQHSAQTRSDTTQPLSSSRSPASRKRHHVAGHVPRCFKA